MDEQKFKAYVDQVVMIAELVMPKASESSDPEMQMLGALGAIPGTFEWLVTKISFLTPDDLEGLIEWQEYVIGLASAKEVACGN